MSILKAYSTILSLVIALSFANTASAQSIRTERISFAPGQSGSVFQSGLQGDEIADYVLNARGGQRMVVDLSTNNSSAYFNLMPSGDPAAIHIGNAAGNHFDGTLPASGDWVIRVYLMRSVARRGEQVDFSLSIHIGGAEHSIQARDFADGETGGPDYWAVTDVSPGDHLNVRGGPSTQNTVIARVINGQVFRSLGCRNPSGTRWCHVESGDGLISGWVAGRYLRESGPPSSTSPSVPASDFADGDAGGPDFWEVHSVGAGDYLNMRTGPSARYSIVARAANGQKFRNLGCRKNETTRWCHIQTPDGKYDAWVAGRYLRETSMPSGSGSGLSLPSGSNVTPDVYIRATGEIEVSWFGGCTALYNPAGNRIQAGSTCSGNQLVVSDATAARFRR